MSYDNSNINSKRDRDQEIIDYIMAVLTDLIERQDRLFKRLENDSNW